VAGWASPKRRSGPRSLGLSRNLQPERTKGVGPCIVSISIESDEHDVRAALVAVLAMHANG